MATPVPADIRCVAFSDAAQMAALVQVLDAYARDPMGGGEGLSEEVKARLPQALAACPTAISWLAWVDGEAVGLLNAIEGFSSFAARPLLNVHDLAVLPAWRGRGLGRALLRAAEAHARQRGACKLTLEVLSGNTNAAALYASEGYALYALDPAQGTAQFMQKPLGN